MQQIIAMGGGGFSMEPENPLLDQYVIAQTGKPRPKVCFLPHATDDAIRSLVISQRLLGTQEIILIHHTDCGMLTFKDDDVKGKIESEVGIRPAFALEAFASPEGDVKQSIARIQASPFIPNKSSVRGFVYDVKTGRLNEVRAAAGVH